MRFRLLLPFLVAGCSSPEVSTEFAALRMNPDSGSTAELRNVVSSALGGADVLIADDALTASSWLLIEPGMRQRIDGPPELGRNLGEPERFQLLLDANQCFLVHERTGLRWLLADTDCIAE